MPDKLEVEESAGKVVLAYMAYRASLGQWKLPMYRRYQQAQKEHLDMLEAWSANVWKELKNEAANHQRADQGSDLRHSSS